MNRNRVPNAHVALMAGAPVAPVGPLRRPPAPRVLLFSCLAALCCFWVCWCSVSQSQAALFGAGDAPEVSETSKSSCLMLSILISIARAVQTTRRIEQQEQINGPATWRSLCFALNPFH